MAPQQGPSRRDGRPKARTPAERAEEAHGVQRRLKQEAADRRKAAAADAKRSGAGDASAKGRSPRRSAKP